MSNEIEQPSVKPTSTKSKLKPRLLMAFVAIFGIFLAIPYYYTSNPSSCARCHNMKPYYESWKNSYHSVAVDNCFSCHVKQGFTNLWAYRIGFYRELFASITGAKLEQATASLPATESCQKKGCHSLNRVESGSGDLKINHRLHVMRAGLNCIKCHPGAAHPNVGSIGKITPPSEICKECHAARITECTFCHREITSANRGFSH